ncbi:putative subtilisin-like serine protease [Fusarium globosum]|uniref:Putative subtilisin-like serine protease n=1 Tax=Fusarium globosum TaxID=78864 RepID=A0A8H5YCE8_9HYPO|nr:putative subtilisin-like serine protease [Fusarium globosum]
MKVAEYGAVLPMQRKDAESLMRAAAVSLPSVGLDCTVSRRYVFNHWSFRGVSLNVDCNKDIISTQSIVSTLESIEGVGKAYLNHRSEADSDTLSIHIDTGVARLRAENITGAGIRVAVLDGGFDLTVPGLSLTSIDYTHDVTNGGDNVQDECWYHDTHVLGIIGAKGNEVEHNFSGVAPDALYELFRIQACDSSSATQDALLASLIDAAGRGVDVITCSYGSPIAWPEDPWTTVADRVAVNGKLVFSRPAIADLGSSLATAQPMSFGVLGVIGGTNMSTPFAAGVAALVRQKYPEYSADDIRNGGGLVDAWSDVHTNTLLSTTSLSFNDTAYRTTNLAFNIKNSGKKTAKYRLSHIGAGSGYVLGESGYNLTKAEAYPVYADIHIHPGSLEMKPGSYVAIEVEGATNRLTLPYTGLGAPLLTLPDINRDTAILAGYNTSNCAMIPLTEEQVFNCTLNTTANLPVTFQLSFYPGVKVDLVVQSRDFALSIIDTDSGKEMFVMTHGSSEDPYLAGWTRYYDGTDANYFHLPEGRYHWWAKALKLTGDPKKKEDDYDIWESGSWILRIVY